MLADIVERLSNWKHASFRRDGSTLETMHEAAEAITTLRARVKELESGGWISVDTALPELRDDSVIAHFANGSIETIHIEDYFKQITNGFDANGNQKYTKWYLHSDPPVTNWQPLPNPPKD